MQNKNISSNLAHFISHDYCGITRARSFPEHRLDPNLKKGLCWTPANLALNPFGQIVENEWGALGDLIMLPDASSEVSVSGSESVSPLRYFHADFLNMDGSPWEACPRQFLKRQLKKLELLGIKAIASFEHEFMLTDVATPAACFSLQAARSEEKLCNAITEALIEGKVDPEMCIPEYAARQYEVTCSPTEALQAADRAVNVREIVREICRRQGRSVSFSPILSLNPGTNGVHVHVSLWSMAGEPLTYDPNRPGQLSDLASQFTAGILEHMAALTALTAPSVVSYQRLRPDSWSAAYACIGQQNREASIRIAPITHLDGCDAAKQANIEYRAADALASPHLTLGAILAAGIDGINKKLAMPDLVAVNPSSIPEDQHHKYGMHPLPSSLSQALEALGNDEVMRSSMGEMLFDCYRAIKQSEITLMRDKKDNEIRDSYSAVY
ncbi:MULTISPECIES: glutamine synthetase [Pseudomonas]|uniref:Glutamine synthetase n=1 Tax=Pseudomonas urmiensis TaxID=2745493 RepID=A0A923FVS6_9PSED|nr:glutamine synthetase [Pseudomonas urmiensis]MBV4535702.1 glutamine synthetase [Pseudomonas urmiensis]HEN8731757.1 glutamine synthetase [Pseudomonas putida]